MSKYIFGCNGWCGRHFHRCDGKLDLICLKYTGEPWNKWKTNSLMAFKILFERILSIRRRLSQWQRTPSRCVHTSTACNDKLSVRKLTFFQQEKYSHINSDVRCRSTSLFGSSPNNFSHLKSNIVTHANTVCADTQPYTQACRCTCMAQTTWTVMNFIGFLFVHHL